MMILLRMRRTSDLKIEIARQDDRMAPSGSAILRSLQNESLPVIDLVIRESFQNSLDAGSKDTDSVNISVKTNLVLTQIIAPYFNGLSDSLLEKLPSETTVLSIADSNTSGLTGEVNTTDPKKLAESNIYKLIYGINMNQEGGDAGGSWGLGKTSFFRIGSGIVIYYTRIKTDIGEYEERLAACLIEDSTKEKALMPDNLRGIAWWGDKKNNTDDYERTYPITDSDFIHNFLDKFGLVPYVDSQTGTNIIIPFIEEDKLVIQNDDELLSEEVYWWERGISDSIRIAIKRWYLPRLFNPEYKRIFDQPYLACTLNKEIVQVTDSDLTYYTFRELYDAALTNTTQNNNIIVKEITLKQMGMEINSIPIGRIAYRKKSFEELGIINGSNLLPTAYIGDKDYSRREPAKVLGYARKPGMVVEYVVNDNDWMGGVHVGEDEFVLAFFVPNSDGILHERYRSKYNTLENYLRATENADHANWTDIHIDKHQVTMIKRLKKEISKIMASDLGESLEVISNKRTSTLSRKYGQLFLPKMGFGKSGTSSKKSENSGVNLKGKGTNGTLNIISFNKINNKNEAEVIVDITIPKKSTYQLVVNVVTIDKVLNFNSWEKTFGDAIPYPFILSDVSLKSSDQIILKNYDDQLQTFNFTNDSKVTAISQVAFKLIFKDITMKPTLALIKK